MANGAEGVPPTSESQSVPRSCIFAVPLGTALAPSCPRPSNSHMIPAAGKDCKRFHTRFSDLFLRPAHIRSGVNLRAAGTVVPRFGDVPIAVARLP
jgi:hypothetical protein